MPWKIKQRPEDFVVREVMSDRVEESWKEKARLIHGKKPSSKEKRYLWFTLRKTGRDFFDAISSLAGGLGISTRDVGYAGTKDKAAVTFQTVSVPASCEKRLRKLRVPGLEASDFRKMNRHVRLGEHEANAFEVTVRNLEEADVDRAAKRLEAMKKRGMVNYFGEQRFGAAGKNHVIGRYLVMDDVENAVLSFPHTHRTTGVETALMDHLAMERHDYAGALAKVPLRLLKLFVHAYQSYVWNRAADECSGSGKKDAEIPLVGYGTRLERYPGSGTVIEGILRSEGVTLQDFRNRRFPKLSSRGASRDLIVFPKGLEWEPGEDELNGGMRKLVIRFTLPPGSYGTVLVEQAMKG
jgi:tRNA pseudouridine13 synthase